MAIVLQRHLGPVAHLDQGQWTSETASGKPAVSCSLCGNISELDEHTVDRQGNVTPRWCCPNSSCPVMEFLRLESFGEEVLQ